MVTTSSRESGPLRVAGSDYSGGEDEVYNDIKDQLTKLPGFTLVQLFIEEDIIEIEFSYSLVLTPTLV